MPLDDNAYHPSGYDRLVDRSSCFYYYIILFTHAWVHVRFINREEGVYEYERSQEFVPKLNCVIFVCISIEEMV